MPVPQLVTVADGFKVTGPHEFEIPARLTFGGDLTVTVLMLVTVPQPFVTANVIV